ncbi:MULTISPECIES: beta-ketoacyl-ACP synthase II [Rothia]|uniref:3-oxoacyl-[acyl-carrier-protein] synthase 2 n=1 Tax=Rothia amarae TaxID=169480 RepID=A0A7H2BMB6_9MICC|nr:MULTISPECIES: beta-ketoacyl-ACP synthase II [Rothia]QNV40812.1 beta-ketoacyl-ACP synthase II [Rothia amarae]SIJ64893.1 3-oxoacyl-[acyl-carrier-protein] synthase 1 KasA [Mycobacteroides abscessus subsp. abscessus]
MSHKVVVTGLGATTPIGGDVPTTWANALKGVSGIKKLEDSWVEEYQLPVYIAGRVAQDPLESGRLSKVEAKRQDPSGQLALVAAREAWADAGFSGENAEESEGVDPLRTAVSFGTGIGGVWTLLDAWDTLREKGPRRVLPMTVPMLMPNSCAAAVSMALNARAAAQTVVSACASSTEALDLGLELIRSGKADIVIAGGAEAAIHPMPLAAFAKMQALSSRNDDPQAASRPYDVNRDGFVMGEGAAALILESEEHAKARGAKIYAELAGTGVSADSYHITAPDPQALGATRALKEALEDGDIDPTTVVHVNAHATSTPVGDIPESLALHQTFGEHTKNIAVSATKSMTGHLLGGAGALEAILTVKAIEERKAPCTINLDQQDEQIDLDVVTDARELPSGEIVAMSNSFGFGGHNAVVAFRSYES